MTQTECALGWIHHFQGCWELSQVGRDHERWSWSKSEREILTAVGWRAVQVEVDDCMGQLLLELDLE